MKWETANFQDNTSFKTLLTVLCSIVGCGILAPWLGIEPEPPAVEMEGLNHWSGRKVPGQYKFNDRMEYGTLGRHKVLCGLLSLIQAE